MIEPRQMTPERLKEIEEHHWCKGGYGEISVMLRDLLADRAHLLTQFEEAERDKAFWKAEVARCDNDLQQSNLGYQAQLSSTQGKLEEEMKRAFVAGEAAADGAEQCEVAEAARIYTKHRLAALSSTSKPEGK